MTDDRHDPDELEDLRELLSLADRPLHFPEPVRGELLEQVIRTASMPPVEGTSTVRSTTGAAETRTVRPSWTIGIAASLLLVLTMGLALVVRGDGRSDAPADQVLPPVMTVDEVCDVLRRRATANGLGAGSVQIADVQLDELDEQRRLLARLAADEDGPVDTELVADAITRIRLMEIAIESSDTSAAANAMTAARASVRAVIDEAC